MRGRLYRATPNQRSKSRFAGYAGPSRRPAAEAISKYILVDTYAKAVQGMPPTDAVKWAHGELSIPLT
jgi:multiple sugar transport system substrate-binding protein